ncbi:MAG TPA: protein-export chaperone SecB [Gallionellaceae bacterium]|nr:protein-export chaperone SecB [Gallionellaceae bacterium]
MSEADTSKQPFFNLEKMYVKDLSVEVPHAPGIYLERETPRIDLQIKDDNIKIGDDLHEVTVTAVVTARLQEKVVFLIEATQAAVFRLRNIPDAEMESALRVMCPNILYPYLREVVSDNSVRAGFMPVLLSPLDFSALYLQEKQQEASAQQAAH